MSTPKFQIINTNYIHDIEGSLRIIPEQHRSATPWLAIRQGKSRMFPTHIDALRWVIRKVSKA